jgi:hypothetical protein
MRYLNIRYTASDRTVDLLPERAAIRLLGSRRHSCRRRCGSFLVREAKFECVKKWIKVGNWARLKGTMHGNARKTMKKFERCLKDIISAAAKLESTLVRTTTGDG